MRQSLCLVGFQVGRGIVDFCHTHKPRSTCLNAQTNVHTLLISLSSYCIVITCIGVIFAGPRVYQVAESSSHAGENNVDADGGIPDGAMPQGGMEVGNAGLPDLNQGNAGMSLILHASIVSPVTTNLSLVPATAVSEHASIDTVVCLFAGDAAEASALRRAALSERQLAQEGGGAG